jgi:beta-xylosidase
MWMRSVDTVNNPRNFLVLSSFSLLAAFSLLLFSGPGPGESAPPGAIDVILTGNFPDPSIVRVGDDFYMTHSSSRDLPGLFIWHSRDLMHWERVGYALKQSVGDVWAPDFVRHGDRFYIYFPAGRTNWVVSAPSPEGPWSEPVDLGISGIDPGHIAAPDGKRYLYQDDGYMVELAADGLSAVGPHRRVYEGWRYPEDWTVEGFYLESPKLTFFNSFYYLTSAQGGTAGPGTSHMVVSARSKSPLGPWENSPLNPVVHTWSKKERYLSKGHSTIFNDAAGRWFIVYHAYENGYLPLGRQTLIEPILWTKDGWFRTVRDPRREGEITTYKNVLIEPDDFSGKSLKLQWQLSGIESLENVAPADGVLTLGPSPEDILVLHITPGDHNYEASVKIEAERGVEAGLILYYGPKIYAGIAAKDGYIFSVAKGEMTANSLIEPPAARYFKIRLFEFDLTMQYSEDGIRWKTYPYSLEVSGYHHHMLAGFSSLKVGIYCLGEGRLRIDDFNYRALD